MQMVIAQIVFSGRIKESRKDPLGLNRQDSAEFHDLWSQAHFHVIQGDNERKGKPIFLKEKKKLAVIESLFCALPVYSFHFRSFSKYC